MKIHKADILIALLFALDVYLALSVLDDMRAECDAESEEEVTYYVEQNKPNWRIRAITEMKEDDRE